VAFLGRSNVGKSSLLNALSGNRSLARVSAQPGRTQMVNFFRVNDEMYLADLPGYGYARVPEAVRLGWEKLVTSYLVGRRPLALGLFLVDARHDPMKGDLVLQGFLEREGLPYVVAATKADKLGHAELARRMASLRAGLGPGARDVVATSASTKLGVDALWRHLSAAASEKRLQGEA
jgi:GTP-binding protein